MLPSMISDWREELQAPDLPVFVVELSGFCNEYDTHTFLTHCDQKRSHLTTVRIPHPFSCSEAERAVSSCG